MAMLNNHMVYYVCSACLLYMYNMFIHFNYIPLYVQYIPTKIAPPVKIEQFQLTWS